MFQNSDNENTDREDIFTEVVYLEDEMPKPKETKTPSKYSNIKMKTQKKRPTSFDRYRKSSSDEEPITKYSKYNEEDEELNKFSKYIVCLLKTVPKDVSNKLQMDIVNLIMTAKLKTAQNLENKVVYDTVPVTIQPVGTVPGTSFLMMPNTSTKNSNYSEGNESNVTETVTPATTVHNSLFAITPLKDTRNDNNDS